MQRVAAVAGLALFGMVGVAYADAPGGWSQFDHMVKQQAAAKVAQGQQMQQVKEAEAKQADNQARSNVVRQ